jgi:hypothetical protein
VHTPVVLTTVLAVTLCGRTVMMLTLAVLALRGTTPSQRPPILMALAASLAAMTTSGHGFGRSHRTSENLQAPGFTTMPGQHAPISKEPSVEQQLGQIE